MVRSIEVNINLISALIKEVYHVKALHDCASDFLQGIDDLLDHELSMHIIPYEDMSSVIHQINIKLNEMHTTLSVLQMSIKDLCNIIPFFWTYKPSGLYITIKFPSILSTMAEFQVHKIITFSIPLNDSILHASQLQNSPELIPFVQDNMYYTYQTANMITSKILDARLHNLPLYQVSNPTCITAIYFENKRQAKRLCDFRVVLNGITPTVRYLNGGNYPILNVSSLYLTCPSGHKRLSGCAFCIHEIPSLCDVATGHVYCPPRLTHCTNPDQITTEVHAVNLATLMHLFDEKNSHIQGDIFPEKPLAEVPDINIYDHNFSQIIANDKNHDLSLKRIAQAIKNDKVLFQTFADPILDSLAEMNVPINSLFSRNSILTIINAAIMILITIGCI